MEKVPFSKWLEIDLRTAKILDVQDVDGKDKLFELRLDVGGETRTLVAGIKKFYSKEELAGKTIILFANLEPKKFGKIESNGMLLAADDQGKPVLLTTDKPAGPGLKIM